MNQSSPLAILAGKLTLGPPSLSMVMDLLDQAEPVQEFVRLVREFLPDREREIMTNPLAERIQMFTQLFGERYFPLHESVWWVDEEDYYELISYIPISRHGINWDDYHEIEDFLPGIRLLMAIVENPYEIEDGVRVPLLEHCAGIVGKELIKRVPKDGWSPETLHRLLDGTRFEAAALWADCLWRQTETVFLDVTWEDDLYGLDWTRENVEYLQERWPRARETLDRVSALAEWLEEEPREHFRELIETVMLREDTGVPEPKTLIEVFSEGGRKDG